MNIFDSDINDAQLDNLFEHRGKPDPEKLAERNAMRKRGIARHRNAIAREKEYEERRKARLARRKEMEKMGKAKSEIDRELGTDEEFEKKYRQPESKEQTHLSKIASDQESRIKQTYQRIKKQDSKELDNDEYDKYKNHISNAQEESKKSLKSISTKNSHQAKAKIIIGKSIDNLSDTITTSIRDGEKVNLHDLILEDFEKRKKDFSKFMENQKLKEDEWKTEDSKDNWYKKYTKEEDEYQEKLEDVEDEKDYHQEYQDLQDKNDFYTRKLKRLQEEYNKKKSFYSGNQHKLEQLKKEYDPKIKNTKDKISQTDIKTYDDYLSYVDEKKKNRNEKLRKNPVINWFKMSYFRAIHPIVKMFSSVESFRSFLWDD